ncbi:hypothetical protein [Desulfoglaeba alkanexedens]|uniref:DUF5666 domain-containing protein n=1 Tax=Desulfoglaeba alkanexedens ALDC TaxID=980445 RepID=A0A4P8L0Z4_9BACT|nr:hypothetical protein [Desulfoglaeba alkanexedens]QCQ21517.1 hypothetical protein FDQ92_04600 [Desulfoglaeba alkanexedens ALDC]
MLRKLSMAGVLLIAVAFCFAGWAVAADVVQGKCVEVRAAEKTLVIEEYDVNFSDEHPYGRSTGVVNEYLIDKALVGIPPEPGDILRIAYEVRGTDRVALKVMNVSKQDLRKK